VVIEVAAIWGAVTGTIGTVLAASNWLRDQAHLKLSTSLQAGLLHVKVLNDGRRPITIEEVGIEYSSGESYSARRGLPVEVAEKQAHEATFRFRLPMTPGDIVPSGNKVFCFVKDVRGHLKRRAVPDDIVKALAGKYIDEVPMTII
jgi:hypothetical protein